jgi:membrane-associated phospholipid phosphatase
VPTLSDFVLRSPKIPLLGALATFLAFVATGVLAYLVPGAQVRDEATLQGFQSLDRPRLTPVLDWVSSLANPSSYGLLGFALICLALLRRRPRVAVTVAGLLLVTGLTTRTLKPLLAQPRTSGFDDPTQIAAASWPSGHATASMTLALCAILVVPARARPTVAALGAAFAIAVGYSIVALGWHFPSDVIGGYLVATTWTLLAVAGLIATGGTSRATERPPGRVALGLPVVLVASAGLVAAGVALTRPRTVADTVLTQPTFALGAGLIAALALLVAGLVARLSAGGAGAPVARR